MHPAAWISRGSCRPAVTGRPNGDLFYRRNELRDIRCGQPVVSTHGGGRAARASAWRRRSRNEHGSRRTPPSLCWTHCSVPHSTKALIGHICEPERHGSGQPRLAVVAHHVDRETLIRVTNRIYIRVTGGLPMDTSSGDMRIDGAPSYPDTMDGSMHDEQAALVALLQTRPEGMRWPEITAEVLEAGSAIEVWRQLVPATLMGPPGQPDALESAAQDMDRWASQGCKLVTILDGDYPVRLRGIHQAPPMLFARGTLIAADSAVSLVGSRTASDP